MGMEERGDFWDGGHIYTLWLIHVNVCPKTPRYCKNGTPVKINILILKRNPQNKTRKKTIYILRRSLRNNKKYFKKVFNSEEILIIRTYNFLKTY